MKRIGHNGLSLEEISVEGAEGRDVIVKSTTGQCSLALDNKITNYFTVDYINSAVPLVTARPTKEPCNRLTVVSKGVWRKTPLQSKIVDEFLDTLLFFFHYKTAT